MIRYIFLRYVHFLRAERKRKVREIFGSCAFVLIKLSAEVSSLKFGSLQRIIQIIFNEWVQWPPAQYCDGCVCHDIWTWTYNKKIIYAKNQCIKCYCSFGFRVWKSFRKTKRHEIDERHLKSHQMTIALQVFHAAHIKILNKTRWEWEQLGLRIVTNAKGHDMTS